MNKATGDKRLVAHMAGRSDTGRVRSNNEDYLDWDTERGLALLADGVGGGNAGEVASRMAVATLLELIPFAPCASAMGDSSQQLRSAIEQANHRIYENGRHPPFFGMSTTLLALWLCGEQIVFAHVGDSRIYRLRNGKLTQLTVDHSLIQEMLDNGLLSPEQAATSTNRHVITRALGVAAQVEPDLLVASARAGDRYLLCSDGLSDMLDDAALHELLAQQQTTLTAQADTLIAAANLRGGEDNISALLVAIEENDEPNPE